MLEENGWDLQRANQAYMNNQSITLQFQKKDNKQVLVSHSFLQEQSGLDIITALNKTAPVRQGEQHYNLYREGGQKITYTELSARIGDLKLNKVVLYSVDSDPNF